MGGSTERPRRIELMHGGFVVDSGYRRFTKAKRSAVVWVITATRYIGDERQMTIPEIRHCLHALANKLEAGEGDDPHDTAAVLRYLAEQTRRAPRGSRKTEDKRDEGVPEQQAAAE